MTSLITLAVGFGLAILIIQTLNAIRAQMKLILITALVAIILGSLVMAELNRIFS